MPIPNHILDKDFFDIGEAPPVIPCMYTKPKGRGVSGFQSIKGFEGFQLMKDDGNKWRVQKKSVFTVKAMEDGYCEIPATKVNRLKLEGLLKPTIQKTIYDKPTFPSKSNPKDVLFRMKDPTNPAKEIIKIVDDEALEKGWIRVLLPETIKPPIYKLLKTRREFDTNAHGNRGVKEKLRAQLCRPWAGQFVRVHEAELSGSVM